MIFLKNKVGVSQVQRQRINKLLFGVDGAAGSDDSVVFDQKLRDVRQECDQIEQGARFTSYLDKRLIPLLRDKVFYPNITNGTGFDWTNNNLESMNHLLKTVVDWKPRPLPELVKKLSQVLETQQKDIRRALVGMGNYTLHHNQRHYGIRREDWTNMTDPERLQTVHNFLTDKHAKKNSNGVTSTDGKLKVLTTPPGGK